MISTRPFLYTPTHEYVVPRSIPMTVPGPPPGTSGLAAAATATAPRPPMPIRRLPSRTRPNPTRADGAVVFIAAVVAGEGRAMVCGCRRGQALVRDRSSGLRWWGWRWWGLAVCLAVGSEVGLAVGLAARDCCNCDSEVVPGEHARWLRRWVAAEARVVCGW